MLQAVAQLVTVPGFAEPHSQLDLGQQIYLRKANSVQHAADAQVKGAPVPAEVQLKGELEPAHGH